jgi:hypothetical protein
MSASLFQYPGYRNHDAEFLKIDFPRLPLTGDLGLFRSLARIGGELTALHLLESPALEKPRTNFVGSPKQEIEKVSFMLEGGAPSPPKTGAGGAAPSSGTVFIDKAQTTGFEGVREDVWNFHIGGYQVGEKWLKDRKGRTLTKDDLAHYHKIVIALAETIRLTKEIDVVIEKHGGWPGAFAHGANVSAAAAPVGKETLAFAAEEQAAYGAPIETASEDELPLK